MRFISTKVGEASATPDATLIFLNIKGNSANQKTSPLM